MMDRSWGGNFFCFAGPGSSGLKIRETSLIIQVIPINFYHFRKANFPTVGLRHSCQTQLKF